RFGRRAVGGGPHSVGDPHAGRGRRRAVLFGVPAELTQGLDDGEFTRELRVVAGIDRAGEPFVFPAFGEGRPAPARVARAEPVSSWRLHDRNASRPAGWYRHDVSR